MVSNPAFPFEQALASVDRREAERLLLESARAIGFPATVDRLVVPALHALGVRWERGDASLSQIYMSGRICEQLIDRHLAPSGEARRPKPKMAIGVFEDHHVLGKRIVYSVLRCAGFQLLDYGHGLGPEELVRRVADDGVEVLLLSVLMLRSALRIRDFREELRRARPEVRLVVGGAPFLFDPKLGEEVGADAWGTSAEEAVAIAERLAAAAEGGER